jgi:cellular nucleic acid-binding protein
MYTAKQCYHCQGLGHVQADCPTLRLSGAQAGGRCYTCGMPGHLAVSIIPGLKRIEADICIACLPKCRHASWSRPRCPNGPWWIWGWLPRWLPKWCSPCYLLQVWWTQPLRPGLSSTGHEVLCMRQARTTSPLNMQCCVTARTDMEQGHISRDCTAPNGGPLNTTGKVCYKCGQAGHISRDCTSIETNGTADLGDSGVPAAVPVAAQPMA